MNEYCSLVKSELKNIRNLFSLNRQVRDFVLKGFFQQSRVWSEKECSFLRNAIDTELQNQCNTMFISESNDRRIFDLDEYQPGVTEIIDIDRWRSLGESLLGHQLKECSVMAGKITYLEGSALGSGGGWHRDTRYQNQFKVIFYLSDVSAKNGVFRYAVSSNRILNSLRDQIKNRSTRYNSSYAKKYNVEQLVGSTGDAIVVNTRGLHSGSPLLEGERYAITLYFWPDSRPATIPSKPK